MKYIKIEKQWLGYFEDIVDDCKVLRTYIETSDPQCLGMIDGISSVASQGIESIKNIYEKN